MTRRKLSRYCRRVLAILADGPDRALILVAQRWRVVEAQPTLFPGGDPPTSIKDVSARTVGLLTARGAIADREPATAPADIAALSSTSRYLTDVGRAALEGNEFPRRRRRAKVDA